VYEEYQRSLKIYNALDFDDLLTVPIALFEEFPEVLEKYCRRYRYVMVDEFQDTSLVQYKLMKLLVKGGLAGAGTGTANICVVGDDDQSIYSWRGANYENLLRFERDFPGFEEIKLEQNYRSTTTILEAANGVIANNANRKEKRLWSGNGGGRPIELFFPQNESAEAEFIAGKIKKLRFEEDLRYDDFGVLIRTNSQIDTIEEAFLAEDIPCRVSGGQSFFERKEIKDILSYLRVIANPDDDVNLLRIINTPRRGIGKASIMAMSELAKKNRSSLWDSLCRMRITGRLEQGQESLFQGLAAGEAGRSASPKGELESFIVLIESLKDAMFQKGNLSGKVRALVGTIDYWGYLVGEFRKDEKKARWKFSNIEYLIKMIEYWEKDPDNLNPSLFAYLNRVSLLTKSDGDDDAGKGKVNLMTIHASKGLEFPVVFIAGAEEGIIPHERSLEDDVSGSGAVNPIEEERRLFYVAITRARDKLFITSCRSRRQSAEKQPSPFLEEIPAHLIQRHHEENETNEEPPVSPEEFFARMQEKFG
jgi:DNA helicase-2/ATP-dependent DNA helicase PcrA